jgi:hypothetical protein
MASPYESILSFDNSVTAESSTTTQTQEQSKKKWKSNVWEFSRDPTTEERQDYRYCVVCSSDSTRPSYGGNHAGNMAKHLLRRHEIIVDKPLSKNEVEVQVQLRSLYARAQANGHASELDTLVFQAQLNKSIVIEALISLIVVRNLSFSIVEWPEFHALCQTLNPESKDIIPICHGTIRAKVKDIFDIYKDIVRRELQSALTRIHIACDIWTSPNGLLFLAVVAHFTTHTSRRQKALLALKEVPGHSGEDQFKILLPILEDYGIVRQLGAIIADNAPTNDVLCRVLERHMKNEISLTWKANHWRIRCIGHIINLTVQAFLFTNVIQMEELESYDSDEKDETLENSEEMRAKFRLLGPLGKAHNIVAHIRKSPKRIMIFKKLARRMIPMDNRTRWNSWYEMLKVLFDLRSAVEQYYAEFENELEEDILSFLEWKKLRTIVDFLYYFHRATLSTEGDHKSIDSTLFYMDVLIVHFKNTLVSLFFIFYFFILNLIIVRQDKHKGTKDPEIKDFISRVQTGYAMIDKYYLKTDMSTIYAAALILNPSYRTRYIRTQWPLKWQKSTLANVKKLWEKYREEVQLPSLPRPFSYDNSSQQKGPDGFDGLVASLRIVTRPASEDEFEDYNSQESYDPGPQGALAWWCQDSQRKRWPRLSIMAIEILSIPPMSDEPERVFSGARRTITWDRGQLLPETIEMRECLKHWKKSGILNTFLAE